MGVGLNGVSISPGNDGALAGIVVVDATQMLAGPLAGMRLGDLGADVIKVEMPVIGEFTRTHGLEGAKVDGIPTTFLSLNRNKRSLALDLKNERGREVMRDLLKRADVILHNFRFGTAERLGLSWDELHEVNPRLIYCQITGYGSEGPYKQRAGQDLVIQGYSGSMWSVGKRGDPPMPGALFAADAMSGYQAVIAILAALVARSVSGVGQKVEVDMFSVILDSQLQEMVTYLNTGVKPTRLDEDTAHAIIGAPYGVYQTSNGWITLAMCYLPNLGEALQDDWLKSLTGPKDNSKFRDEIYKRIRHRFIENTTEEWLKIFETNGLWGGPVYDYGDVEFDPHVKATGMIVPQQHAGEAKLRTVRIPIQMSENPPSIRRGAPRLGEDSRSVLKELIGYQDSEIDELLQSGVVAEYVEGKGRPK